MKNEELDQLQQDLDALRWMTAYLDSKIVQIRFNPVDPQSIELAIQNIEEVIDEKVEMAGNTELATNLARELKDRYREKILEKAAHACSQAISPTNEP